MLAKFSGYINHIRDTFINASELAREVQSLREQVAQVTSDFQNKVAEVEKEVSDLRQANAWADETLQRVRAERDAAQTHAQELQAELSQARHDLNGAQADHNNLLQQHQTLQERHDAVRRERDDANFRIMELEEENQRVKAQLEGIKAALG